MSNKTKNWIKDAGIRAIKTFAQTMTSMITVGAAFNEVNWGYIASVSFTALIFSILTSLAGLPETDLRSDLEGDLDE